MQHPVLAALAFTAAALTLIWVCYNFWQGIKEGRRPPVSVVMASDQETARLLAIIAGLKRGSCWCESGIGNPMLQGRHTAICIAAQAAIAFNRPQSKVDGPAYVEARWQRTIIRYQEVERFMVDATGKRID